MAQAPNAIVSEPDANEEEQGVVGIQEGVTGNHISKMPFMIAMISFKILYSLYNASIENEFLFIR